MEQSLGYPYLHDASANKDVHVSNASRSTHTETHLESQNTAQTPQHKTTTQGRAACAKQIAHNRYVPDGSCRENSS